MINHTVTIQLLKNRAAHPVCCDLPPIAFLYLTCECQRIRLSPDFRNAQCRKEIYAP